MLLRPTPEPGDHRQADPGDEGAAGDHPDQPSHEVREFQGPAKRELCEAE